MPFQARQRHSRRSADAGIELEVDGFALSGRDGYDPGPSLCEREPVCGRLYRVRPWLQREFVMAGTVRAVGSHYLTAAQCLDGGALNRPGVRVPDT